MKSASPPTDRVLDVIELLARSDASPRRVADVARELGITMSTAHSIANALVDRGWASRDPVDRTLTLGPGLELACARLDAARPLAHAARTAALELSERVGHAVSVTERAAASLVVTFFGRAGDQPVSPPPVNRIPFAAPFGPAFAAWEPEQRRRVWMENGADLDARTAGRLERLLDATVDRGFSVECISPALAEVSQLLASAEEDPSSQRVYRTMREALLDAATSGAQGGYDRVDAKLPVTTLSAPVFDRHGSVALNIAIHPFRTLTAAAVRKLGKHLLAATAPLNARGR